MMSTTILIPFYNEVNNISSVLDEVSKLYSTKYKVVLVNDGSTDSTDELVKRKYAQFNLVGYNKNCGKSAAIRFGLQYVRTKTVILIDADLNNFKIDSITQASYLWNSQIARMIVFKRSGNSTLEKLLRVDYLLSGERMMLTNDLRQILENKGIKNYELELGIPCSNNNNLLIY